MPGSWDLYQQNRDITHHNDRTAIRLMGGDRKAIEQKTGDQWNQLVEPRTWRS